MKRRAGLTSVYIQVCDVCIDTCSTGVSLTLPDAGLWDLLLSIDYQHKNDRDNLIIKSEKLKLFSLTGYLFG